MNENGFRGVIGHKGLVEALKNAVAGGRISHAYLFAGDPGSGKKFLATTFAAALECEGEGERPCMKCRSCRKALSRNHPDISLLVPEKPDVISVGEIRELTAQAAVKPYEGKYKIFIINDAEKMNQQAQNALLKTLEEPPAYMVLMLLANRPEQLLPTIASRCVRLDVETVPDDEIKAYLMGEMDMTGDEADVAAAFAQGNVGRAKAIAEDGSFAEMAKGTVAVVSAAKEYTVKQMLDAAEELAPDKESLRSLFNVMLLWFRDVLLFKATQDPGKLVFRDEIGRIRQQAVGMSYGDLENVLDAIERATTRIGSNVSREVTLELLFAAVAEAVK